MIPTSALSLERQRMVHSNDVLSPYPILSPCQGEEPETVPFCLKSCACNVWHLILYDYMCMQNEIQIACRLQLRFVKLHKKYRSVSHSVSDCT